MPKEGQGGRRDLLIAGVIALAAALALLLDSRMERRAYHVDQSAESRPRVHQPGASSLAPLAARTSPER